MASQQECSQCEGTGTCDHYEDVYPGNCLECDGSGTIAIDTAKLGPDLRTRLEMLLDRYCLALDPRRGILISDILAECDRTGKEAR